MSKFNRRVIVLVLSILFSSPLLADDGFDASVWQEIWENMIAIFSGDENEGGSVYVPSGLTGPQQQDEGGSVYVPSGATGGGSQQQDEGGSVYVPSG